MVSTAPLFTYVMSVTSMTLPNTEGAVEINLLALFPRWGRKEKKL